MAQSENQRAPDGLFGLLQLRQIPIVFRRAGQALYRLNPAGHIPLARWVEALFQQRQDSGALGL